MPKQYVIVGGNVGGCSAAARLRRLDERAHITILEKGLHISFSSSGLPYYIGGIVGFSHELTRSSPENYMKNLAIEARTLCHVLRIDRYEKTVKVRNLQTGKVYKQKYDKLILATGCEPKIITGTDGAKGVFTLKNMDDMASITAYIEEASVRRVAIIGGGDVGLAVAENISRRGIKTCVIEKRAHALPVFDPDMAQFVKITLENNGVALLRNAEVNEFHAVEEGLRIELPGGRFIIADMIVICAGLKPEVFLAQEAGLGIGVTGGIIVDEHQQTTDKDIYAVGDAVEVQSPYGGKILISRASPATRQGRIAADNICGIGSRYKHTIGVSIVKLFDTCFGAVGLTERQLGEREIKYEKAYLRALSHESYYPGSDVLIIKLMFDKRGGRIYGVQIVGKTGVDKRIDVISAAMSAGLTADKLAELELAYAPPFSVARDAVNMAGYVAANMISGLSEVVHWHELKALGNAVLIDVRPMAQRQAGTIAGSLHLPLDELRERLGELPEHKQLVLFSQSGHRSYTAERMLRQYGYNVKNLSGGYSLYEVFSRMES